MSGHDDDGRRQPFQGERLHDFDPVLARHLHIAEHDIKPAFERGLQAAVAVLGGHHLVLLVFENVAEGVTDESFVVDDENAGHGAKIAVGGQSCPMPAAEAEIHSGPKPSSMPRAVSTKMPSATVWRDRRTSSMLGNRSSKW